MLVLRTSCRQFLPRSLYRRSWERRQLTDITGIMLNNDRRLGVGGNLLDTIDRGNGLCAVSVETRHAVALVVFVEMCKVATQDNRAHLRQPDQESVVSGRMSRRVEHHNGAIAKNILILR